MFRAACTHAPLLMPPSGSSDIVLAFHGSAASAKSCLETQT